MCFVLCCQGMEETIGNEILKCFNQIQILKQTFFNKFILKLLNVCEFRSVIEKSSVCSCEILKLKNHFQYLFMPF